MPYASGDVAIDTVVARVQLSIQEPCHVPILKAAAKKRVNDLRQQHDATARPMSRRCQVVVPSGDLVEGAEPGKLLCLLLPEVVIVVDALAKQLLVLLRAEGPVSGESSEPVKYTTEESSGVATLAKRRVGSSDSSRGSRVHCASRRRAKGVGNSAPRMNGRSCQQPSPRRAQTRDR
jgi:hypothetical protein